MSGRSALHAVDSSPPPVKAVHDSEQRPRGSVRASAREWALDKQWPVALALVLVILAVWQIVGLLGRLPEYILSPTQIVGATRDMISTGELPALVRTSLMREFSGFVLGAGGGVLLGLIAGVARWSGDVIDGAIGLLYPVPKIALLPVIAIWLGFTDSTRIIVIALACFFPAYLNAQTATRSVDPNFIWVARNANAGRWRTIFQVILPAALPRVLVGVRTALALSFVMMFATEVIGASGGSAAGLGGRAFAAGANGGYDVLWAVLLTIAVLGLVLDSILRLLSTKATRGVSRELADHG